MKFKYKQVKENSKGLRQARRDFVILSKHYGYRDEYWTHEQIAEYLIARRFWRNDKVKSVVSLCQKTTYKYKGLFKFDIQDEINKDVIRIERVIDTRPLGKLNKIDLIRAKHDILTGRRALVNVDQSEHHTLIVNVEKYGSKEDIQATRRAMESV